MVIIPDGQPYIQAIHPGWYGHKVAELSMLRLDIVHHDISGNKWYKLKHNIEHCISNNINRVLTFGGAYSNHLAATAAMANLAGLQSVGVVRGLFSEQRLTPTLQFCRDNGMALHYISYEDYSRKGDEDMLQNLGLIFPGTFIIPEGGANDYGRLGAEEIAAYIPDYYTHIAVSVGTGTTLVGIVNRLHIQQSVRGFAPMKGGGYLNDEVCCYIHEEKQANYKIYDNWHFGGFGKYNDALILFMNDFYKQNNIPLDVVYTAKMMSGIKEQVTAGVFDVAARILCIHTGGLQGNTSLAGRLIY